LVDSFTLYDQYDARVISAVSVAYNYQTGDFYFEGYTGPYRAFFYQYSIVGDSVIARWPLSAASGQIAISPDAQTVYVTDGGNTTSDIYPRGDVFVFNANTRALQDVIAPYDYSSGPISAPFFGLCVISPDGRRAYLGSLSNNMGGVPLRVVDLSQNKIIKTIRPYSIFDVAAIVVGRKMK
jgi:DNA-binding beta-propeller fold protein YncE